VLLISTYTSFSTTSISLEYKEISMDVSAKIFFCDYRYGNVSRIRDCYDPRLFGFAAGKPALSLSEFTDPKENQFKETIGFTNYSSLSRQMPRPLAPKHLQSLFI
jgi:hypothetical protein